MRRFPLRLLWLLPLVIALGARADSLPDDFSMEPWKAVVLGIVEGLTEYLPVSSTGHLILTSEALGLAGHPETQRAVNAYTIVIQIGAILAVVTVYHHQLWMMARGLVGKCPEGRRLLINVLLAFLPAAVVGLLFVDHIKHYLFGLWPVTAAWLLGGIALIVWGDRSKDAPGGRELVMNDLTPSKALTIGLLQTVAVWPGTSRSLVTILGGRLVGLTLRESVIFSFLLGMVTLGASTAYDLLRNGEEMLATFGMTNLIAGLVAAWLSAWIAVKGMVGYLKKHGLKLFGGYRVGLAVFTAVLILTGVLTA